MNKLYIFCGIPFAGKTTLAEKIVNKLSLKRVDLDEIKFDLFGKDIKDKEINQEGWDKVYRKMYKIIEDLLNRGWNVVHDTGNFTKHERSLVKQIADRLGKKTVTIYVNTPVAVARKRLLRNTQLKLRFDVSKEEFESAVKEFEEPTEDEDVIIYNSGKPINVWIKKNFGI